MVKQVQGWLADDGSLHLKEDEAKGRDFEIAFHAYCEDVISGLGTEDKSGAAQLVKAMIEDRMKLLPIFKLLNGGNGIPPAPRAD